MHKILFGITLSLFSLMTHAHDEILNETLVRVINQLNATLPLLNEAEEEMNPNARIQLHISQFTDAEGIKHAGVRDDLMSVRNALIEYINKPSIEPKTIKPLEFDFVR